MVEKKNTMVIFKCCIVSIPFGLLITPSSNHAQILTSIMKIRSTLLVICWCPSNVTEISPFLVELGEHNQKYLPFLWSWVSIIKIYGHPFQVAVVLALMLLVQSLNDWCYTRSSGTNHLSWSE